MREREREREREIKRKRQTDRQTDRKREREEKRERERELKKKSFNQTVIFLPLNTPASVFPSLKLLFDAPPAF